MRHTDPGDQTVSDSTDPKQGGLFDTTPVPVHADPHDTEVEAAAKVQSVAGTLRRGVLDLVTIAGRHGVTPWEAIVGLGYEGREYSIRPRFTELASDRFGRLLEATEARRKNGRGNNEIVWALRTVGGR
jgi:hypothetical protein|tara:strand:- start:3697 stop:4083 length:387 start_codon:yes stop_codon:yes gene_type:complete